MALEATTAHAADYCVDRGGFHINPSVDHSDHSCIPRRKGLDTSMLELHGNRRLLTRARSNHRAGEGFVKARGDTPAAITAVCVAGWVLRRVVRDASRRRCNTSEM
ncbi:unnamed protein product [Boreogadus saida]